MYKFFQKSDKSKWINIGEKSYPIETKLEVQEILYKVLKGDFDLDESTKKELHKKLKELL